MAWGLRARIGLAVGPGLFLLVLLLPSPGMPDVAWRVAAVAAWMVTWWLTEPVPLAATALLPLVLLPVVGAASVPDAAAPFANPVIFLFLGGFLLALAMEKWRLHERIAYTTALRVGTRPGAMLAGFMATTAFLSMWISNTAAVLLMVPMARSMVAMAELHGAGGTDLRNLGAGLFLGTAYAATIGGLATLIGTPPNALLAGYLAENHGIDVGFARWMLLAMPSVAIGLTATWWLLSRRVFPVALDDLPGGRAVVRDALAGLGRFTGPERRVAVVLAATACLWLARPFVEPVVPGVSDAGIAVAAAVALFLLPAGGTRILAVSDLPRVRWDVLLLFGGGLSLAAAFTSSGLSPWIGERFVALEAWPLVALVAVLAVVVLLLTEFTSNTATAAAFLPLVAGVALAIGVPVLVLALPVAMAASCAFMLPVATPPNAVVYGEKGVTVPMMVRAGWRLNLLFLVLVTATTVWWAPVVFGL